MVVGAAVSADEKILLPLRHAVRNPRRLLRFFSRDGSFLGMFSRTPDRGIRLFSRNRGIRLWIFPRDRRIRRRIFPWNCSGGHQ